VDHRLRRERLAERVAALGLEALAVTRLPNVRYLTGFTGSNGQVVLSADGRAVFVTDGRYGEQAAHEVPDLDQVVSRQALERALATAIGSVGATRVGFERRGLTYEQWERLGEAASGVELVPVGPEVERLRRVKDADELALMAAAQEAADVAFERVVLRGGLREGCTEREVAIELEAAMREADAEDRAFDTIVAFGPNAAEPHHHPTDRPLARGDVVKLDFGAVVGGYRSDTTRTVALGEPGERVRELHALVTQAQRAGMAAARAGATTIEVDAAARRVIVDAGFGEAFPHGLGHGVGLEIHEAPSLRWDGEPEALSAGEVVTVEPGVYIPGLGGVRIEDMVEVTADGCRVIPRSTRELVVL
jgi:Xaa-Pro dipeptidase